MPSSTSSEAAQMTLGGFIKALNNCKFDAYIEFDWGGLIPGEMQSYRGYYDHLAIDPTSGKFRYVYEMKTHAMSILNSTQEGYKGGQYRMGKDTSLWVARWGATSDTYVVGLKNEDWRVIIQTKTISAD